MASTARWIEAGAWLRTQTKPADDPGWLVSPHGNPLASDRVGGRTDQTLCPQKNSAMVMTAVDLTRRLSSSRHGVQHGENGSERIIYAALRDVAGTYRGVLETVVPIDEAGPAGGTADD
jgi:hypothetical protein